MIQISISILASGFGLALCYDIKSFLCTSKFGSNFMVPASLSYVFTRSLMRGSVLDRESRNRSRKAHQLMLTRGVKMTQWWKPSLTKGTWVIMHYTQTDLLGKSLSDSLSLQWEILFQKNRWRVIEEDTVLCMLMSTHSHTPHTYLAVMKQPGF